jgi:hypothetical protein
VAPRIISLPPYPRTHFKLASRQAGVWEQRQKKKRWYRHLRSELPLPAYSGDLVWLFSSFFLMIQSDRPGGEQTRR